MTSLYGYVYSHADHALPRCQHAVWFRWLRPRYWHQWHRVQTRYNERYSVCDRCGHERR